MATKKPSSKRTEASRPGFTLLDDEGHGGWFKNSTFFIVALPVHEWSPKKLAPFRYGPIEPAYVYGYYTTKDGAEDAKVRVIEERRANAISRRRVCGIIDPPETIVVMSAPQLGRYVKKHPKTVFSDL